MQSILTPKLKHQFRLNIIENGNKLTAISRNVHTVHGFKYINSSVLGDFNNFLNVVVRDDVCNSVVDELENLINKKFTIELETLDSSSGNTLETFVFDLCELHVAYRTDLSYTSNYTQVVTKRTVEKKNNYSNIKDNWLIKSAYRVFEKVIGESTIVENKTETSSTADDAVVNYSVSFSYKGITRKC